DCPNIHLLSLETLDPISSYHDILHVLRFDGNPPPLLFMVFCNDQKEMERLCQFAHSQVPSELIGKLLWFHSLMSTKFWTETIKKLHLCEIWGIFCTDMAGMVHGFHKVSMSCQSVVRVLTCAMSSLLFSGDTQSLCVCSGSILVMQ
ncbi:hypothetical protein EDB92DRAFT_1807327, partial [Lactarius akahatsu]